MRDLVQRGLAQARVQMGILWPREGHKSGLSKDKNATSLGSHHQGPLVSVQTSLPDLEPVQKNQSFLHRPDRAMTELCCCLVAQLCPTLFQARGPQPTRLLCSWDSPGKNTGAGYHSPLQGIFPTWTEPGSPALAGGFFTDEPPENNSKQVPGSAGGRVPKRLGEPQSGQLRREKIRGSTPSH